MWSPWRHRRQIEKGYPGAGRRFGPFHDLLQRIYEDLQPLSDEEEKLQDGGRKRRKRRRETRGEEPSFVERSIRALTGQITHVRISEA